MSLRRRKTPDRSKSENLSSLRESLFKKDSEQKVTNAWAKYLNGSQDLSYFSSFGMENTNDKKRTTKRRSSKDFNREVNIFGNNEILSTGFILQKMQEAAKETELHSLVFEDYINTLNSKLLFALHDLLFPRSNDIERIRFTDAIQAHRYHRWKQKKKILLDTLETEANHRSKTIPKWKMTVVVDVPHEADLLFFVGLLRELHEEENLIGLKFSGCLEGLDSNDELTWMRIFNLFHDAIMEPSKTREEFALILTYFSKDAQMERGPENMDWKEYLLRCVMQMETFNEEGPLASDDDGSLNSDSAEFEFEDETMKSSRSSVASLDLNDLFDYYNDDDDDVEERSIEEDEENDIEDDNNRDDDDMMEDDSKAILDLVEVIGVVQQPADKRPDSNPQDGLEKFLDESETILNLDDSLSQCNLDESFLLNTASLLEDDIDSPKHDRLSIVFESIENIQNFKDNENHTLSQEEEIVEKIQERREREKQQPDPSMRHSLDRTQRRSVCIKISGGEPDFRWDEKLAKKTREVENRHIRQKRRTKKKSKRKGDSSSRRDGSSKNKKKGSGGGGSSSSGRHRKRTEKKSSAEETEETKSSSLDHSSGKRKRRTKPIVRPTTGGESKGKRMISRKKNLSFNSTLANSRRERRKKLHKEKSAGSVDTSSFNGSLMDILRIEEDSAARKKNNSCSDEEAD